MVRCPDAKRVRTGTEPFVTLRYFGPDVWQDKQYPNVQDWKKHNK